jgi:hypothetical protein
MITPDRDLWLYGSRARGDADRESDIDVLLVADDVFAAEVWKSVLGSASISCYSWQEMAHMAGYGSLFLDHIKRDGRRLASVGGGARRLDHLLAELPQYGRAAADLRGFKAALADCHESLAAGGWPDYELEVAVTVMRHAAILGAYCVGRPDYGRESGFATVGRALGYPPSVIAALQTAYRMHRRSSRNSFYPADVQRAAEVVDLVAGFLADLEEVILQYATPPTAASGSARGR